MTDRSFFTSAILRSRAILLLVAVHALVLSGLSATLAVAQRPRLPVAAPKPLEPLVATEATLVQQDSADDRPCFTLDGLTMYFGSRRQSNDPWRVPDPNPSWKWDSELWSRVLKDSVWSAPINLGPPINNSGGQLNPTISPRGDILYYVGTNPILWSAKLIDGKFQQPQPVPGLLNLVYNARQIAASHFVDSIRTIVFQEMLPDSDLRLRAPDAYELHYKERMINHLKTSQAVEFGFTIRCETSITPDGKYAIMSENFGKRGSYGLDGNGGDDLWIVTISENGTWDSVLSMNGNVNSEYDEQYPYMAADGVTLYFTSNRPCPTCPPGTSGGQDLYRTRFDGTHWTDPVPLGAPFNTPADDYGFSIGPDGETAYFVSNRNGKSRLYQVKLRTADSLIAPKPVVVLAGRVTDAKTNMPLHAEIFIDDLDEEQNKFSVFSDSISGQYVLAGLRGHRFGVQAVASGHLPHSERFTLPSNGAFDRTKLDIALAPEEVGSSVEFKNVYFASGKSTLLAESKLELDRMAQFLVHSTKTNLEISGHTDDVGSDQANQKLSEARAQAVLTYLVSKGVERNRLQAVGYGKTRPLMKEKTDQARAMNRRVEITITSRAD